MVLKPAAVLRTEAEEEQAATIEAARRFARRVTDEADATGVYLFGSRANRRAHRGSDCDLLVVSPRFDGVPTVERPLLVDRLWTGPVGADLVCVTPEAFERGKTGVTLVAMALADGAARIDDRSVSFPFR
jgi:hypothetical protein